MDIRPISLEDDIQTICDIYNYYIEYTVATFETQVLAKSEMYQRVFALLQNNENFLVAEIDQKIVGYAYIHTWNIRSAYSATKEMSIYLDNKYIGQNIGYRLYKQLFEEIRLKKDLHVLIAGITLPNESSVRLHEKFGFKQVSHMKEVGFKFDKWLDVGHWQLILN